MTTTPGLRSVVGSLLAHVRDFGTPEPDTPEYAAFIDGWGDRLMKASGYFREQERLARVMPVVSAAVGFRDGEHLDGRPFRGGDLVESLRRAGL
jgi:hypothetical protein